MRTNKRSGFILTELGLAVGLIAIITLGYYRWFSKSSDDATQKQEQYNAYRIEAGLKVGMVEILNTFEGVCGNIASDSVSSMAWGWGSSSCSGTSPLPAKSGNGLVYSINFGSLSAAAQTSLKNKIASAYSPACVVTGSSSTSLTLFCGQSFYDFKYSTASGLVNTYHTPGTNYNSLEQPTPIVTLQRTYMEGSTQTTQAYNLDLSDVYQSRSAYSLEKMQNVGKMLKTIYNLKLGQETSNTSPAGLSSIDDEYTPWFWEAFGDSASSAATTVCAKNSSTGVCDNLNTANIWRSTTGDSLLWRRLITGLAGGDYRYTVDGYGNALRVYPILSQCSSGNLGACSVTAPTVPQSSYPVSATIKPPYTTVIYNTLSNSTANCSNMGSQAPIECRYPIVY